MKRKHKNQPPIHLIPALLALFFTSGLMAADPLTITAVNKLSFARPSQTIELSVEDLSPLAEKNLSRIRVRDADGKELLCQAVDSDGDSNPDLVIFQADFAPRETRTFTVFGGEKWVYTKEQFKAFGRFARERFDDFAWENDRIAHRMYGKALETWQKEPLTSSTVDIWSKRVSRLVVNDWYLVDNYHTDTGEGADFYSAGRSRGCGGNGLWAADTLWVSRNFVHSRVLASGPIRVLFELTYEAFDVNGIAVKKTKRISLDAGQNLDHFESLYQPASATPLITGIGIRKADVTARDVPLERGILTTWQPANPKNAEAGNFTVEDKLNLLMLARVPADNRASYWAGFCWDKSRPYRDYAAWKIYIDQFAQGLLSPIEVQKTAKKNPKNTAEFSGAAPLQWSVRMADSEMARRGDQLAWNQGGTTKWDYTAGLFTLSLLKLNERTTDPRYVRFAEKAIGSFITPKGTFRGRG